MKLVIHRIIHWVLLVGLVLAGMPGGAARAAGPEGDTPGATDDLAQTTTHYGRSAVPPPEKTDEQFVIDRGAGLDKYTFRDDVPDGRMSFDVAIDRYYSPLITPAALQANGLLKASVHSDLVERNLLPERAVLTLQVYDVDHNATICPEVDYVWVNGTRLQNVQNSGPARLTSGNNTWSTWSLPVSTALLRFPSARGTNSQPPTATKNTITIEINVLNCLRSNPQPNEPKTAWAVEVDWAMLTLASPVRPVVFAHGWTGNTDAFDEFADNLREDGIPSADQPNLLRGIQPIAITSPELAKAITRATAEFGVSKVNVFAHSKGGLVARHAMRSPSVARLVDHLVTFSSPHHGTDWPSSLVFLGIKCTTGEFASAADRALCKTAADELKEDSIRLFNYNSCRQSFFLWSGCQPNELPATGVEYRTVTGPNRLLDINPKSATYPWKADARPFPNNANVDQIFEAVTHSSIITSGSAYKCAVSYLDSDIHWSINCLAPGIGADGAGPTGDTIDPAIDPAELAIDPALMADGELVPPDAAPPLADAEPAMAPEEPAPDWAVNPDPALLATEESGAAAAEAAATSQLALQQAVSLSANATKTVEVKVDTATQAVFTSLSAGALSFSLTDPSGKAITPDVAQSDPNIDFLASTSTGFGAGRVYAYTIRSPRAGTWKLALRSTTAQGAGLTAEVVAPIALLGSLSQAVYAPSATATIYAALANGATELTGVTMGGTLTRANGSSVSLTFRDNGTQGDTTANDGIYTAQVSVGSSEGQASVRISATKDNTIRIKDLGLVVMPQTAKLAGVVGSQTADTNANSLYDTLTINLKLDVKQAGHFEIQGTLVDPQGATVAVAGYTSRSGGAQLGVGQRTVPLIFDGRDIRASGKNGPYKLTNVVVSDATEDLVPVDSGSNLYTTSTYQASRFEGALLSLASGSDTARDTNGNKRFDELTITLNLNVILPGTYSWNGRLVNAQGIEIGWAVGQGYLSSQTPMKLAFEGKQIGVSRLNGPYYLRDVSVFQLSGGSATALFSELYMTQAYTFTQFEGGAGVRIYLPLLRR